MKKEIGIEKSNKKSSYLCTKNDALREKLLLRSSEDTFDDYNGIPLDDD
jgi:hypothetical protein